MRAGDIALCPLEDHMACFCRSSGTTHILDAISGELLNWLVSRQEPATAADAQAHIAELMDVPPEQVYANIESALQLLVSEQLVEQEFHEGH